LQEADRRRLFQQVFAAAVERAVTQPGFFGYLRSAGSAMMEVSFGDISAACALIVVATLIFTETPIFTWLTFPFAPLLEWMQLPEAAAAPGLLAGCFDQFLPAVIAKGITSETTRFVLTGLSLSQLIFLSEMGVLILKSELPLNALHLLEIFLLRTVIVLPIYTAAARNLPEKS
jgi:nucleoside recognition membrane protein YjiH